jgi:hypothetical protein
LARFVLVAGVVEPDPGMRLPGRGAYLHRDADCARAAARGHGFERAFRAPVAMRDDLLESVG